MSRIVRLADANDTPADAKAIEDLGALLAHILASPDADAMIDPMYRLTWLIIDHARAIRVRETRTVRCA